MKDFSYVIGPDPAYIELLYNEFVNDPATVDPEWKKFFEGFDFALNTNGDGGVKVSVDKHASTGR